MTLDENVYANPYEFCPERYLPKPIGNSEPYPDCAFGFGRRYVIYKVETDDSAIVHMTSFHIGRKCPGRFLGENSLWIVAVSVLAAFDITRVVDEHGQEIMPDLEYATGVTRYLPT